MRLYDDLDVGSCYLTIHVKSNGTAMGSTTMLLVFFLKKTKK